MKLLFLDFDGVLHPTLSPPHEWFARLPLVEDCIRDTDVRVVISSSWRFHYRLEALRARFAPALWPRIIDVTGPAHTGTWARHAEIEAFLRGRPVRSWRALDDAWFEFPGNCPELIRCDGATGVAAPQCAVLSAWARAPVTA
jgi:hypothetical protein